jgi:hypothetical protein
VTAGAAQIEMPKLPQNALARLETVIVAGDNLGGATITLYRDRVAIENVLGAVTLGASDTATSFSDGSRPWLYGLERVVVVVSGAAAATRVAATVWQSLYFIERPSAQPVAPAPEAPPAPGEV